MNFDLVPRRYRVTDEQIDDGDFQAIVTPLWWEVSIYDGETEMYDSLDRFTDPQKYVWAIQWYYSEVENGGHDQFFYNDTGIVWELALEGLRVIGCSTFAAILEEAVQRIGGYPSKDREARWHEMSMHNADFSDLDMKFYDREHELEQYLRDYVRATGNISFSMGLYISQRTTPQTNTNSTNKTNPLTKSGDRYFNRSGSIAAP